MADIKLTTKDQMFEGLNLSLPPNNEIILDDKGLPSVMVKIPKFSMSDVGLSGGTHPAFIVDGEEKPYIYISKYQNIVVNDRAYSLPYKQPRNYVTFDQARAYCENKGEGWHLMTNAEWAAIALWCKKHDCMPYGNNNYEYGDYYHTYDKGAPMPYREYYDPEDPDGGYNEYTLTATGSGPKDWFHNNDFSGIADLNGNVNEWVGGVRLNNGEIQIIANNDAAQAIDQSASSTLWKAIAQNGSLVAPGTAGVLKYGAGSIVGADGSPFKNLTTAGGVTIPALAKALALFPADESSTYRDDYFYAETSGERLCFRGGYCRGNDSSGVFCAHLYYSRSFSGDYLGFRSAFVEL
ncbi:MAG: SUMF1/EgtB/PvdO family nonheme iron enzyme [Monoglobales bacterium]